MSRRARLLNAWLRRFEKPRLARAEDPVKLRRQMELSARIFLRAPRGTRFDRIDLSGIEAVQAVPRRHSGGPVIFYLHGGGFILGSPHTHRAPVAHLAALTGLRAILTRYRLAPEAPFPAALEDAMQAYRALGDPPGGVILGGDSAGGGLALALLARILAEGLRPPLGTFGFSPFTDLTFSGASFTANAKADPMLPAQRAADLARMYLNGADPRDPRASPLFADFTGAGPVWITAARTEILLDDARRIADRLMAQGVDVTCVIEGDLPHAWPMFQGYIPEARQSMVELAAWISTLSRL
ncbi:alpha/beta hydrolase [Roseovarius aquimarinus]|uniref:Alpha/beta hydrolase n=1 Tax=Roseovarius aquimarinus TaxID=1229156 RepID=A0ABW7I998_9RHOB